MGEFKEVEVMALFEAGQRPRPMRFRCKDDMTGESIVIKVDRVLSVEGDLRDRDPLFVYRCESIVDGVAVQYEMGLRLRDHRWYLRVFT